MAKTGAHALDPRGLILEAYRMDGLTIEEARAIFLDWALGLAAQEDPRAAAQALLAHHGAPEAHPMTRLLREASDSAEAAPRRSGGRAGRIGRL
ncbi:hypothetical protein H0I76_02295 [Limibaculum sp. M0105]|uniref:Uncharacterized protein n=1 Tax=Thermohalobaculum xanthum TaxID=2753746 RepID=A0A8J7SAM9_9RHOB|nr:hypothetical protein [Thermohalobaculum xanthum]MBK0398008.1 hypothetical protein [Thermohalobaculum xanthum]